LHVEPANVKMAPSASTMVKMLYAAPRACLVCIVAGFYANGLALKRGTLLLLENETSSGARDRSRNHKVVIKRRQVLERADSHTRTATPRCYLGYRPMGLAASSIQLVRAVEQRRSSSVCRVHGCIRCGAAIESSEPCTFVQTRISVCRLCMSQEQVTRNLPAARTTTWGAGLAAIRRA